ncbi:MAG TPA: superinfection immunity protein [Terracidiphilus sp.]|jgi:RsiW-degrading membrane proteinase PrsW (M82 family)|nr:superinfection immunity protein [Terracidiphilus sp.]
MNNLLRLLIVVGLLAFGVLIFALGLARHDSDLMAPFNLILFAIAILVYLSPTVLAVYRNCHATGWIALINIFLGWTIAGWFVAIGWAASGNADAMPPTIHTPPGNPITGHI